MKKVFLNSVLLLIGLLTYFVAYTVTNTTTIVANNLPTESISVKVFGEIQNGSLQLVKVISDEHFTVVKDPYPVYKPVYKKCTKPHYSPEIVDMPLYLDYIPFNGIDLLPVPDIADLPPLSNELAI